MIVTEPIDLQSAIEGLLSKTEVGSILKSSDWQEVPAALRETAFFSSGIENVRFLSSMQDFIQSFLANEVVTLDSGVHVLKSGSRAQFVDQMQQLAIEQGIGPVGPIGDTDLTDIRSAARLGLIFDTQVRQAYQFGYYKAGLDPAILKVWPAQRFVRNPGAKIKRVVHEENENAVRLKSDKAFWLAMNDPSFGGFGVPWGPWGFNSYMDVEDVTREEAEALKLLEPGELAPTPEDVSFTDQLQASVKDLDPRLIGKLLHYFDDQIDIKDGIAYWKAIGDIAAVPVATP